MVSKSPPIYVGDAILRLEKNHMPSSDYDYDYFEESLLEEKLITLTKNEALYLSDSLTILVDTNSEMGIIQTPSTSLSSSAIVAAPIETIQKIGMACLEVTDENNLIGLSTITLTIADLYLLRECCKSYVKIENEFVGFNLLRKIYNLILEESVKERQLINNLTKEIDMEAYLKNTSKKD